MRIQLHQYALAAFFASSIQRNHHVAVLAVAAPAASLSRPTASLDLHEGFLSIEEIDALVRGIGPAADDANDDSAVDTHYEPVRLPQDIADRLRHLGGTCGARRSAPVMTMLMTATTDRHRDCRVPQSEGKVVEDDVAFVFLSSDSESHFEHGGTRVPVVAGNLVKFRGDVPHRTVVPPGSRVRIAGPFHLRTLEYVGSCPRECNDASDCPGGEHFNVCTCTTKKERRRLDAKEKGLGQLRSLEYWDDFLEEQEQKGNEICICKQAEGACRVGDMCQELDVNTCARGFKGNFHGAGTKCSEPASSGIKRGPCCFSDRTDMNFQENYCEQMTPGHFIGEGMYQRDCPPNGNYGACCFDTDCKALPDNICSLRGGEFMGKETTCKDHCLGACCSPEECKIVTKTGSNKTCQGQGANFVGPGSDCMAGNCPTNCQATLSSAESLTFPDQQDKISLVQGDSAVTGQVYKDYFQECDATILPSKAMWYNLKNDFPAGFDRRVTISTCADDIPGASSSFTSSLTVQTGPCTDLACVDEIEGNESKTCNKGATVEFCAEYGKEYHILVHGYENFCSLASGLFTLAVRDDGYGEGCGPPLTTTDLPISSDEGTTTTTEVATTTTEHPKWDCSDLESIFGCPNPCEPGMRDGDAYHPFCSDETKYFQCGYWGSCTLMQCCDPDTTKWDNSVKTCVHKSD
uniref:Chitin-binding type-2 domain-containing protein n=1 Tax=Odontella aurita TaxID=265563 RepID=A0A7S4HRE1_9STRA|mmetsp:Transcript_14049/g.41139  ORF Transcript_14049/g.41139 Transcript_14049/m.41139 type:complete len:690 (+) Transcript_14049:177-2246(+)